MVTKQEKPSGAEKKPTKTVTKASPIKIVKRDMPLREQGMKILAKFYMGEMDLEMAKRRAQRFEGKVLSDEEAVLSLLTTLIRNSDDPQMKAKLMEAVAEYQSICGMDSRLVLGEMHRMELRIFKDLGFEAVTIECRKDACPSCKALNGEKITIEQALAMMPLPHQSCTKRTHSKAAPLCRCRYFGEYID